MANYTNFCCRTGGSNLNSGTRNGSTTEPGVAPDFTYASGSWVQSTRTFSVASGNPSTDGVAVGDFVSVYADGSTVTGYVARVTAVTSTTIVTSATVLAGTVPTDGTSNRTLRVGGAWLGPTGATPWLDTFPAAGMTNVSGDLVRVNLKNDQTYSITANITLGSGDVPIIQGYTSAYGDGGRFVIDGGTSGASYILLTIGASAATTIVVDGEFKNNGATGSAVGISQGASSLSLVRVVVRDVRGTGVSCTTAARLSECEIYGCNQSNTANMGGLTAASSLVLDRVMIHDNTGSNSFGARLTGATAVSITGSVFDSNGTIGGLITTSASSSILVGRSDFYNNGGPGASFTGAFPRVESCNFVKNGTFGVVAGAATLVSLLNCGYGSGTQVNTSGATSGNVEETGAVTYASGVTPWVDPANGDFRINLPAAKGTGRGSYLQTASGYAGMVSTPNIGADHTAEVTTIDNTIYRRNARSLGV